MRRLPFVLFVLLLAGSRPAGAAEEPRALIERAIKVMGGAKALQQKLAVRMKMKGKFHFESLGEAIPVEGENWRFGEQSKLSLQSDILGQKQQVTIVSNGDKSWFAVDGAVQDLGKDHLEDLRLSRHVDRVTELTALLADKGFTFALLPTIKVDGRSAAGLKVSYKDRPDTSLYFDKETGLLIKYAYRAKRSGDKKEVLHETILSDYRNPDLASADEKLLRAAKLDTTGPALVEFIRKQTPSQAERDRARALVRKLGDEAFKVRERASADLVALGAIALPLLREAAKDADREVARRARDCLRRIGEQSSKTQVSAAIRLLGLRKPAGAAEVLLNYLPAADAEVANEARASLFAVAQKDGKPDPILQQALDDPDPARRSVAEAALGKDGGAYTRQPGRRLFLCPHKIPMKFKSWVDGKLDIEIETSDYQFFNAFADKLFAKP